MQRFLLALALLAAVPALSWAEDEGPDKALCPVCAARGETEEENVKAHAQHDGQTYYFCSKGCRTTFLKDPVAYLPPQLPRPAPPASVEALDGEPVDLGRYRGRVVVLDFWATWCTPCIDMMPKLQRLHDTYDEEDLVVIGVSIDEGEDRVRRIRRFVDRLGVDYPIFSDARPTPAWHAFGVQAIPALFLIDRQGQIVAQWLGRISHAEVEAEIGVLLPQEN